MRLLILAAAAAALVGCATVDDPRVGEGKTLAERRCAVCHAVSGSAASPRPDARPFRVIAGEYSRSALERELQAVAEVGHYQMPPMGLSASEVGSLSAYLANLAAPRR
jgi:mono/diheme cytochrome c family protein